MKKILLFATLFFAFSFAEGKMFYNIIILNGTNTNNSAGINYYSVSSGEHLQLLTEEHSTMGSWYGITVDWYVDNIYQFTQGDTVDFSQPGLISFRIGSDSSSNKVQLTIVTGINDLTSLTLPYPLSKLPSNIKLNNLRYTIINPMGQVMEQGIFSGEIILRNKNSKRQLQPGIYFVIYSDALDNRQVLTDKVFVSK